MSRPKILFISHDASRTGAPMVLLHLLRWLKTHTDIPFYLLCKHGGELESEFRAVAPVFVIHKSKHRKNSSFANISFRLQMKLHLHRLRKTLLKENIGVIYANTVMNGDLLVFLEELNCPVICHIHELECWIRYRTGLEAFYQIKKYSQHYIAVSEAVKQNLIRNHQIENERLDVIYEFIQTHSSIDNLKRQQQIRENICRNLGIPDNAFIICASGTTDWRKGPDLFIQLARIVHKYQSSRHVYFLWVGGDKNGVRFGELWTDVKNLGMEQYIRFLGVQTNPLDYFVACDVFVLVSREDPFPLVCLEAASQGKPIVCFDKAGGMREFVEDDAGFVVPYLALEVMAHKIIDLLNSSRLRQQLGQKAQQKVRENHDIEVVAPKVLNIIEKFLH